MSESYDPAGPRALYTFVRFLSATARLFTCLGVEVRIYWIAVAVVSLGTYAWASRWAQSALESVTISAIGFVTLFTVIWTHEMGHILEARRHGIRSRLITLSPLGGLAHFASPMRSPREEIFVALAGPAVHLVWLGLLWPLSLFVPDGLFRPEGFASDPVHFTLAWLVDLNLGLLWFNLLPIFPMDGGRVLRALLSLRLHPNRATLHATTVGIVGAAGIVVWGFASGGLYGTLLVFLGLHLIRDCIEERRMAKHVLVYGAAAQAEVREVWQSDPDAWRSGGSIFGAEEARGAAPSPRGQGFFARWRSRRARDAAERRKAADRDLDREVDRILQRIHEVGMAHLTQAERKTLKRAAERRRGAG